MSYDALRKIREKTELKALEGMTLQEINAVLVKQKKRIDELESLLDKQDKERGND